MHIKMSIRMATAVILMGLVGEAGAFYLPGVAPRKYKSGERMRVKVNTLTSDLTPLQVINRCHFLKKHPATAETTWSVVANHLATVSKTHGHSCRPPGHL